MKSINNDTEPSISDTADDRQSVCAGACGDTTPEPSPTPSTNKPHHEESLPLEMDEWVISSVSSLKQEYSDYPEDPERADGGGSEVLEGGWGWVCVVGAALLSFLCRGILSSFTLVFEQMRRRFESSAMATAWVYSMYVTIQMCTSKYTGLCSLLDN